MRCKNKSCGKVHKHSQKGETWKIAQLCPTCFKKKYKKRFAVPMVVLSR